MSSDFDEGALDSNIDVDSEAEDVDVMCALSVVALLVNGKSLVKNWWRRQDFSITHMLVQLTGSSLIVLLVWLLLTIQSDSDCTLPLFTYLKYGHLLGRGNWIPVPACVMGKTRYNPETNYVGSMWWIKMVKMKIIQMESVQKTTKKKMITELYQRNKILLMADCAN